ncbi:acyltransferase [Lysobacter koreensis]|uniref:Acyltransferase n=1 Tax=Lysobacter koreensis TaxID=266122 RepID=A0ABW2YKV0_9GAMM
MSATSNSPAHATPANADWKQRPEGGGWFAIWLIRTIACRGGRALARVLLVPITAYFVLVRGPERRASRDYLARVLGRPPRLLDVARHVHTFAATILDRVFLLSGQLHRFDIRIEGLDAIHTQIDRGQGLLMFGSHLGSFEVMRVLARQRPDIQVRVVLDKAHNPAMTQLLDALNPEIARTVIDAGQDGPSIVLAIKQATDAGALVALLVDRARPGEAWLPAPFLGRTAPFPIAPWLIAATLKVPVALAFGLYRGGNRYQLAFEVFSEGLSMERHNRMQVIAALVQRYAARLQHHARSAPYNWFNFYDFWHADDAAQHGTDRPRAMDRPRDQEPAPEAGVAVRAGPGQRAAVRRSH